MSLKLTCAQSYKKNWVEKLLQAHEGLFDTFKAGPMKVTVTHWTDDKLCTSEHENLYTKQVTTLRKLSKLLVAEVLLCCALLTDKFVNAKISSFTTQRSDISIIECVRNYYAKLQTFTYSFLFLNYLHWNQLTIKLNQKWDIKACNQEKKLRYSFC